jgi:hypothetical protein
LLKTLRNDDNPDMEFQHIVAAFILGICIRSPLQSDGTRSKSLPTALIQALSGDEKAYCEQFLGDFRKGCHRTFRANLSWRELVISPSGEAGILVENGNTGFCGTAGCSIYLFVQQPAGSFLQVLGRRGDIGTLTRVAVLNEITRGHYDVQVTWSDGKTHTRYRWNGARYVSPDYR